MADQALDTRAPSSVSDLDNLARQINTAHDNVSLALLTSAKRAVECGGLLQKAKDLVPHGQWEAWIEENTAVSARTARSYMQTARCWDSSDPEERQRIADLGLRALLDELADPLPVSRVIEVRPPVECSTQPLRIHVTEEEVGSSGPFKIVEHAVEEQPAAPTRIVHQRPTPTEVSVFTSLRVIARAHPALIARASMLDTRLRLEDLSALLLDAADLKDIVTSTIPAIPAPIARS